MDWVVFGDDWGRHPSTTQHLVRHLPGEDRVVWVDSIGMRAPRLSRVDLRRLIGKLAALNGQPEPVKRRRTEQVGSRRGADRLRTRREALFQRLSGAQLDPRPPRAAFCRLAPAVAPWHLNPFARLYNRRTLARVVGRAMGELGMTQPVALLSNPVGGFYLRAIVPRRLVYLRLDDYAALPGVDAALVARVEPPLLERADLIVALSDRLVPPDYLAKTHYLPQGVDLAHFASVPLDPPRERVLGYYGSVARWLDVALIVAVARAHPDWRLELAGPITTPTASLAKLPNVALLGPVPYAELPHLITRWRAAWLPFRQDAQIEAANSLKLREYLAAGLPVAARRYPEAEKLRHLITFVGDAPDVGRWLRGTVATDAAPQRLRRRTAVAAHAWDLRADRVRALVAAL